MEIVKIEHRLPFENTEITLSAAAVQERQELLDKATVFQDCPDAEKQGMIVRTARMLKALVSDVEKFRKAAKEPFIRMGQKIDTACKEYVAGLDTEAKRLGNLTIEFQAAEKARIDAAEAKRFADMEQARKDHQAAKEAAEAAQAKVTTKDAGINEAEAAALATEEAEKRQKDYDNAVRAGKPKALKATGQSIQKVLSYEVTDVHALLKAHPSCVSLIPIKSVIREYLEAGHTLPGVKHQWTDEVRVRS